MTVYEPTVWVNGNLGGTSLDADRLNKLEQGVAAAHTEIEGKAPASHSHTVAQVTGLQEMVGGKADASHTHQLDQVTGLQDTLNAKAAATHGHSIDQVSGLSNELNGKAASVHAHSIDQVTGLQATLNGKAPSSHTHPMGQVDGLGTALAGKAAASHTHPINQVDGLQAALAGKPDLVPDGQGGMVVPTANIPARALHTTKVVGSQAEMLALTPAQVQEGDMAKRTDLDGVTFVLGPDSPALLSSWIQIGSTSGAVDSVNGQVGVVVLGRGDVGLGQVDNTPDAEKPVSTAQAAALAGKAAVSHTHTSADVLGLPEFTVAVSAELQGKAPVDHTHTVADVSGLQDALDAKAPKRVEYTHPVWGGTAVTNVEVMAWNGALIWERQDGSVRGGDGPPPEWLPVRGGDVWIDFTTGKRYEYEQEDA